MLGLPIDFFANFLIAFGIFLEFVSYLPQIVKLIKTKRAVDLSLGSWILWTGTDLLALIYAFLYTKHLLFFIYYCMMFLFILITLMLTIKYRNNSNNVSYT
jgi:uncharacterized protein with PQ loop repeat